MAIVHLAYCNASLGKTITFDFDNASKVISNVVVGATCSTPEPTVIHYDYGPFGLAFQGIVTPQNTAPYAAYSSSTPSAFAISSVVITPASTNNTSDGIIQVNTVGNLFSTQYSIDGGATWIIADISSQSTHVFTDLAPGTYTVLARTYPLFGLGSVDSEEATVGFTSIDCDLGIGTVQTEAANGSNGKIKVLSVTGYPNPVEYRLDAGAWQDSAEFTGLTAGVYSLQVRYKSYTSCAAFQDVAVSETDSCDLSVTILPQHEQSKYADDGALQIVATSSNPPLTFSLNGGTPQTDPYYAGLSPGVYELVTVDDVGCSNLQSITIYKYKSPYVVFPIANPFRFVKIQGPGILPNRRQNFDNTLFSSMRFAGASGHCYSLPVELVDIHTYQFRSNYVENVVQLYTKAGVLTAALTPLKRSSNIDKSETFDAFFVNGGSGKVQVFFETGLPTIFEIGADITITDQPLLNGTYEIEDIREGTYGAVGFQVLIIAAALPSSSTVTGTVTTIYDLEPYEVYEFTVPWAAYSEGEYYFKIISTDPQFAQLQSQSEPVESRVSWPDHVLIRFNNYDNSREINYDTGIEHQMRVKGFITFPQNPGERTVYTDSRDRLVKLDSYVRRVPELHVFNLPWWVLEKLAIAVDSDYLNIEDTECQTEDDWESEYFQNDAFGNGKVKVRQVDFMNENGDDTGPQTDVDVLGDNETLLGVS